MLIPLLLLACAAPEPADGHRPDTNTDTDTGAVAVEDADRDGWTVEEGDCNDEDYDIRPNIAEECDGIDQNCDGQIDESVTNTYYRDIDDDGYGNSQDTIEACRLPDGYRLGDGDCDDADADQHPGNPERCDGLDQDCDRKIDDGALWYPDEDDDGYGTGDGTCDEPADDEDWSHKGGDCDDADAAISPEAEDVSYDGLDNDCDGVADDLLDHDGDGYSADLGDCDDTNPEAFPGADEVVGDGIDNNCNGLTDEREDG